jgi:hypothetical protein
VQASADPMYAAETSFHIDMTAAVVAGHVRSLAIETSSTRARLNRGMAPIDTNRRTSHPRSCPSWTGLPPRQLDTAARAGGNPGSRSELLCTRVGSYRARGVVSGLRPARRENSRCPARAATDEDYDAAQRRSFHFNSSVRDGYAEISSRIPTGVRRMAARPRWPSIPRAILREPGVKPSAGQPSLMASTGSFRLTTLTDRWRWRRSCPVLAVTRRHGSL